jgi:hypothetical protein
VELESVRDLTTADVTEMLRRSMVQFVINDAGKLEWIPREQCYAFWKAEVKGKLVEPDRAEAGFYLDDFPGEYCYLATECKTISIDPVVVLRKFH